MPTKGTYTALQKLKPITVDWGEVADTGNKRQDIVDAKNVASAKLRQEKRDALGYDTLAPVITGIDSLDKGLTLGIQDASTLQHEDYKKALNDPTYADSAEYKIRTKNLNNYSKNVKEFSDGFSALAKTVMASSQEGTLSEWDDDLLGILNGGFVSEKVKFGVAGDGGVEAYIASTDQGAITDENPDGYLYDEDGKIKMVKVTPNEVFKGLGKYSVTGKVDIQGTATKIGTELGKSITSKVNGREITSEQSWESKKDESRKIVRGLLGSPKSPTAMAKRLWADEMGESSRELTEENMTRLEDEMLAKVKPFYDEEVKKTKTFASATAGSGKTPLPPMRDGIKISTENGVMKEKITASGKGVVFTLPVVRDKKGLSSPKIIVDLRGYPTTIESLTLIKGGRISYDGWVDAGRESGIEGEGGEKIIEDGEEFNAPGSSASKVSVKRTKRNDQILESDDLNKVARGLGFDNEGQLREHLRGLRDNFKKPEKKEVVKSKSGKTYN